MEQQLGILGIAILIVLLVVFCIGGPIFLRALTAKLCTGKWPHQSAEAKSIYDSLP